MHRFRYSLALWSTRSKMWIANRCAETFKKQKVRDESLASEITPSLFIEDLSHLSESRSQTAVPALPEYVPSYSTASCQWLLFFHTSVDSDTAWTIFSCCFYSAWKYYRPAFSRFASCNGRDTGCVVSEVTKNVLENRRRTSPIPEFYGAVNQMSRRYFRRKRTRLSRLEYYCLWRCY
jgi:hypothetical protein